MSIYADMHFFREKSNRKIMSVHVLISIIVLQFDFNYSIWSSLFNMVFKGVKQVITLFHMIAFADPLVVPKH